MLEVGAGQVGMASGVRPRLGTETGGSGVSWTFGLPLRRAGRRRVVYMGEHGGSI